MITISTYAKAIDRIVQGAVIAQNMSQDLRPEGRFSSTEALDNSAQLAIDDAYQAKKRIGGYRFSITSEEQSEIQFIACVAQDILYGDVARPSVGNVRQAALAQLNEKELAA